MFNPMQTQAALQNPAQFPDQRLQQYAAGQPPQPTGQVPPGPGGPAGLELTSRNAQRQAAARASAMQNDPSQSPTIFQQKDAQIAQQAQMMQQKEMQLAQMMQQKEAQIAKKEQALGLIGALMARSQPRMSGIAQLPMRPDMYTAMDGGIVFKAGGGVQRLLPGEQSAMDAFTSAGLNVYPKPPDSKSLTEELDSDDIIKQLLALNELKGLKSRLSPEERKRLTEEEEAKLAKQYEKYEAGMTGVDEKAVAAARGRPYSFWSGIAAGLPTDTKNLRVAEAIASLARGVAGERARAQEGESRAAALLAEAERKRMERQFQEERGRPDLAKKAAIEQDALIAAANREEMDRAKFQQDALKSAASNISKAELAAMSLEQKAALARLTDEYRHRIADINGKLVDAKISALDAAIAQKKAISDLQKDAFELRTKLGEQSDANKKAAHQLDVNKAVNEELFNDVSYQQNLRRRNKLLDKDSLTPAENAELTRLTERLEATRRDVQSKYLPASSAARSPALPNEVKAKDGKVYARPPNFTDAQWAQYVKEQGIK